MTALETLSHVYCASLSTLHRPEAETKNVYKATRAFARVVEQQKQKVNFSKEERIFIDFLKDRAPEGTIFAVPHRLVFDTQALESPQGSPTVYSPGWRPSTEVADVLDNLAVPESSGIVAFTSEQLEVEIDFFKVVQCSRQKYFSVTTSDSVNQYPILSVLRSDGRLFGCSDGKLALAAFDTSPLLFNLHNLLANASNIREVMKNFIVIPTTVAPRLELMLSDVTGGQQVATISEEEAPRSALWLLEDTPAVASPAPPASSSDAVVPVVASGSGGENHAILPLGRERGFDMYMIMEVVTHMADAAPDTKFKVEALPHLALVNVTTREEIIISMQSLNEMRRRQIVLSSMGEAGDTGVKYTLEKPWAKSSFPSPPLRRLTLKWQSVFPLPKWEAAIAGGPSGPPHPRLPLSHCHSRQFAHLAEPGRGAESWGDV